MRPVHWLGVFIPIAIAVEFAHADPVIVFSAAALGVILVILGVIFWILGAMGRAVGGRRHYY